MSVSLASLPVAMRALGPLINDIYNGAKGEAKKCLEKWGAGVLPKKLLSNISFIDTVRTIWSPEKSVSLSDFYYPSKLEFGGHSREVRRASDVGGGCVVIQGIVGQGKSILLRYIAMQELLADSPRMPIFFELRRLSKTFGLMDGLKSVLSDCDVSASDEVFSYLASSGKVTILLDGFDELDSEIVKETTLSIEALARRYLDLQIIVTSRPHNEIQKLSCFRVLEISPLESDDYSGFLGKLGVDIVKADAVVGAIKQSPSNISELISTPLMLTLVVLVYQSENHIPAELPDFFERLFYTVFTRHDKLKPAFERQHYSKLSERKLQSLFEAFCFMSMQIGNGRTLNAAQFTRAFDLAQSYIDGSKCQEDDFRKDITRVSCLMLEEGFNDATFLHKSIAEYHASSFIKNSDDVFVERFYAHVKDDWSSWGTCLSFLKIIDPYRFAKYFAIDQLMEAIDLAEVLDSCPDEQSFVTSLPAYMCKLRTRYEIGAGGNYYFDSFGTWSTPDNYYNDKLIDVVSDAAMATVPNSLTVDAVTELRDCGIQVLEPDEHQIDIGLLDALHLWGFDKVQESVALHLADLLIQLDQAKSLADKLERRALIFDGEF